MPGVWAIEDGQTISLTIPDPSGSKDAKATIIVPTSLAFSQDPVDASLVDLTMATDTGDTYVMTFSRNGLPTGPASRKSELPAGTLADLGGDRLGRRQLCSGAADGAQRDPGLHRGVGDANLHRLAAGAVYLQHLGSAAHDDHALVAFASLDLV